MINVKLSKAEIISRIIAAQWRLHACGLVQFKVSSRDTLSGKSVRWLTIYLRQLRADIVQAFLMGR